MTMLAALGVEAGVSTQGRGSNYKTALWACYPPRKWHVTQIGGGPMFAAINHNW